MIKNMIKNIKDFFDTEWDVEIIERDWKIYSVFRTNWWRILGETHIKDDLIDEWIVEWKNIINNK